MNITIKLIAATLATFALSACDVEKTQDGKMPEVKVEGGQMPKYDVDTVDVDVGTETKEVTVPTIDVDMPDNDDDDNH